MQKDFKDIVLQMRSPLAAAVLFFIVAIGVPPACLFAEGEDYYSCVDGDGRITITNQRYDERTYRCTAFSDLNKTFKQAEMRERKTPAAGAVVRPEREVSVAAESARLSAESARTSMEAARTAAEAAHLTVEAARLVLTPHFIIISPQQHSATIYRHHDRYRD